MHLEKRKRIAIGLKLLVSAALLGFLLSKVDLANAVERVRSIPIGLLVVATLMFGTTFLVATLRLRRVLSYYGCDIGYIRLLQIFLYGNAFSTALPGVAGGDLVMMVVLQNHSKSKNWTAPSAVLLDRGLALLVMALISALMWFCLQMGCSWVSTWLVLLIGFAVSGSLMPLIPIFLERIEANRLFAKWEKVEDVVAGFIAGWRTMASLRLFLPIWFLSWVNHGIYFGFAVLLLRAFDLPLEPLQMCAAIAITFLATCLPISLNGHGVREATLAGSVAFLTENIAFEEILEKTLGFSAVLFLITLFWALCGLLFYQFGKAR